MILIKAINLPHTIIDSLGAIEPNKSSNKHVNYTDKDTKLQQMCKISTTTFSENGFWSLSVDYR